jgi:hypothetical protein
MDACQSYLERTRDGLNPHMYIVHRPHASVDIVMTLPYKPPILFLSLIEQAVRLEIGAFDVLELNTVLDSGGP